MIYPQYDLTNVYYHHRDTHCHEGQLNRLHYPMLDSQLRCVTAAVGNHRTEEAGLFYRRARFL